ncbi:hypothetical protein HJFPF1_12216 [Paramyrothecium foliicola]|nr:hypothetical protein HJFPF1_12216 [Paramyrothecium foliicola]
MAQKGLSYYCWGIFLGDLRYIICLRADDEVPESLFFDRHHRPYIPLRASQILKSGLCANDERIEKCVDTIINTWPMIPEPVTTQIITSLVQNKCWGLLSPEEQCKMRGTAFTMAKRLAIDASAKAQESEMEQLGTLHGTLPNDKSDSVAAEEHQAETPHSTRSSGYQGLDLEAFLSMEGYGADTYVPDLMHGTLFASFLEPG